MNRNVPRTLSELYPSKWLVAADIQKPVVVTIISITIEELRQADGSNEPKLVISFRNASKKMIANVTQAKRLAELLGTEVFADWVGARVKLAPGKASNGKPTIVIVEATKIPAGETGQGQLQLSENGDQAPPAGKIREGKAVAMGDAEAAQLWHKE